MATVAEPLTQFEIPSSKSTAPPVFFNEPESARTTLPRSQELGQAFPIPADVAAQLVEENSALVEMGSRQGTIIGVVPGNIGFRTERWERATGNYPPEIRESWIKSILWALVSDAEPWPAISESALAEAAIEDALRRVHSTSGFAKVRARTEAVQAINRTGALTQVVDHVIRSLIGVHRSGRIDDAIDILSELGNLRIRALATTLQQTFASNGSNDDYWYAVIRAAGRSGDREIPKSFLSSQFTALQEAAVEALGDIGDHAAVEVLKRIAGDPTRPSVVRELARELVSELASNG